MALIQRSLSSKRKLILTASMLGVVLLTVFVAYFGLYRPESTVPPPAAPILTPAKATPAESGFETLEVLGADESFQSLKKYGQWPLATEPRGNSAPFVPPTDKSPNTNN